LHSLRRRACGKYAGIIWMPNSQTPGCGD
jgi:hypothetical protein